MLIKFNNGGIIDLPEYHARKLVKEGKARFVKTKEIKIAPRDKMMRGAVRSK